MTAVREQAWLVALGINVTARPAPLPELLHEDGVAAHRKLECRLYDDCLDAAVHQAWTSWTCKDCELARLGHPLPTDAPPPARTRAS